MCGPHKYEQLPAQKIVRFLPGGGVHFFVAEQGVNGI